MQRILIILSILLIIGGISWYIWNNLGDKNTASIAPADSEKVEEEKETDPLKTQAFRIVSRPIIVKKELSDDSNQRATAHLKEIIDLIKKDYDYINAWYDLGAYRIVIGDYEGAIEAYDFAGLIRPKDYISFHNLGDLYGLYLKDYKKAEQNFLKSIENNSRNMDAYLQLAMLYENQEKLNQAENILLLGTKADLTDILLRIALGRFYQRIGRISDALKYFEEALKLNPADKALEEEIEGLKSD